MVTFVFSTDGGTDSAADGAIDDEVGIFYQIKLVVSFVLYWLPRVRYLFINKKRYSNL